MITYGFGIDTMNNVLKEMMEFVEKKERLEE